MPVEPHRWDPTDITLLVTDRNLNVVGDPITCWDTVDCTNRFNEAGSGMFTAPAYPWLQEQIEAGYRIVVLRNGEVFSAGPWEEYLHERSDDGENSGDGKLTVHFSDDLASIASHVSYPNPALTPETQDRDYYLFLGNAEVALRNLVNLNAGPGARAERRVPRLELGTLAGVGSNVSVRTRLEPLGDVMRKAASEGRNSPDIGVRAAGLGFRTRQVGKQILFEVYAPQDKTNTVRFGFNLGNLRYLGYERKAPTATTAIVGGQGEGADRFILARTNVAQETAWGRSETWLARPGNIPQAELQGDGDAELAEQGETTRLQSSAWDTVDQKYGVHYGLGDRVSIQIHPGREVSDLVRLVHLQAWATAGHLVSAMVGNQDASSDPRWVQQIRALNRQLYQLKRSTVSAA